MATTADRSRFLDLRALAALETMRFATPHRVEGRYSGQHASRQRGGSGEFVDFREYSGSEDLRRLDWKVLARTGKAFIRLHQEETNLRSLLAIDTSASMQYAGDPKLRRPHSKLEYVQYLMTGLSHVISLGRDHVGLALLDSEPREVVPPGGASVHIAHVQSLIESIEPHRSTTMAPAIAQLFEQLRGKGVLLLASDFLADDLPAVFAALRLFRHRGWEVVVLHVTHPDEERLPEGIAFRFEDMEDQKFIDCSPDEIRELYEQRFAAHMSMVRRMALGGGCSYHHVSTVIPYIQTLSGFLVERSG